MSYFSRKYQSFLYLTIVLLLNACSNNELEKIPNDGVILAFGDSLTSGVGVNPQKSYPSQLSNLTQLEVINAGVSGETTQQGVIRFSRLLEQTSPNFIILLEGGNDILRNLPESQTVENLSRMIERAQQDNIPILLIGVPKKSIFSSSARFYDDLAEKYGLILEDEIIARLIKNPTMKSDSVHFNQQGYLELANTIHQILIQHGALEY